MRAWDIIPLHVGDLSYPNDHVLAGQTGPVLAFAVRHPAGIVLLDTGIIPSDDWINAHYHPRVRAVRDVLREASIDPDDVVTIINTHLHFDHAGQGAAFPGVPILVQQVELEEALAVGEPYTNWLTFPEACYVRRQGDFEVHPGIHVLSTPGHTAGHQSVAVETDDGLVLIVGQAAEDAHEFEALRTDPSIERLRSLDAKRIHFSHDRTVLRRGPERA